MRAATTGKVALAEDAVEDRITDLYRLHPRDFVAARNDLAAEVKQDDPDRAKTVRKLRKPTLAAWGLNVVSQDEPQRVADLRAAGAALHRAQAAAVGGGGDEDIRSAEGRRRDLVRALTDAAVERAGESQRDKIAATVEAASVDDAVGDELSSGRMTKPRPRPSGIGDLATMLRPGSTRRRSRDRGQRKVERRLEKIEARLDRHSDELTRARERLADAQKAVESAEQRVSDDETERAEVRRQLP